MEITAPTSRPIGRKSLWIELAVFTVVIWMPYAISGIHSFIEPPQTPSTIATELNGVFELGARAGLLIFYFWRVGEPLNKLGLTRPKFADVGFGLGLCFLIRLITIALEIPDRVFSGMPGAFMSPRPPHVMPAMLEMLVFCLSAFYEEIFDRGYLCSRLQELRFSKSRTIVVSAIMFAIPHLYQGWAPLPLHFVFGIIFAAIFIRFRRLWPLVFAHALYDFFLYLGHAH